MSIDSFGSLQMSNGGSITMSVDDSSVGSNGSATHILSHPGLKRRRTTTLLSRALIEEKSPHGLVMMHWLSSNGPSCSSAQGLENFDEWTD
ncbi:Serine/threonine-protein kinase STY13 [Camellia lanceoleosa]|uniref:Serine/threonine-protein kinase STY13 n=1 Tax=Camellia lanceoleosa TaxID=1840588 RepID=A0ACC0HIG0_9ERIC|nr:Serine/threonine-protein kinase STY13 [Camellia lanceoleosa]